MQLLRQLDRLARKREEWTPLTEAVSIQVPETSTSGLSRFATHAKLLQAAVRGPRRAVGLGLALCCAALQAQPNAAAAGCEGQGTGAAQAAARVAVWVDLSLPVRGTVAASDSQALAMHQAVQAQQQAVAAQLCALGATELARVTRVRNAIVVELPADALPLARQLPGVLRIRPVTHRNQVQPLPP